MGAPQSNLPQHLRTFVEPQIEQFSLRMEPVRCGLYATLPESLGEDSSDGGTRRGLPCQRALAAA